MTSLEDAKDAVRAAVGRFGRIDVLVNNAGWNGMNGKQGAILQSSPARWSGSQAKTNRRCVSWPGPTPW